MKARAIIPPLATLALICPLCSASTNETSAQALESTVVASEIQRGVIITWPTEDEASYTLEWSGDLSANDWLNLINVTGDGSEQSVFDPIETAEPSWYRVVKNP